MTKQLFQGNAIRFTLSLGLEKMLRVPSGKACAVRCGVYTPNVAGSVDFANVGMLGKCAAVAHSGSCSETRNRDCTLATASAQLVTRAAVFQMFLHLRSPYCHLSLL